MANATSTQLQELYVAYFGRAADPTGLDYWTEKGISTADFAADMYAQAEFKDSYGSLSTEAQVNQIYQNLFDREADVTGLTYWTQQINLGNLKVAEIANHLIWAAQNNSGSEDDKTALTNKTNAAVAYTAKVKETTAAILAYSAESTGTTFVAGLNLTEAKSYMSGIDKDTAHTAAGIASSVSTITSNGVQSTRETFDLTTATDSFTGGTGNDTFNADNAGTDRSSAADTLTGGDGTDTLNIYSDGTADPLPTLSSVETANFYDLTADIDLSKDAQSSLTKVSFTRVTDGIMGITVGEENTEITLDDIAVSTGGITLTHDAEDTTTIINTKTISELAAGEITSDITLVGADLATVTINALSSTVTDEFDVAGASTINLNATGAFNTEDLQTTSTTATLTVTGAGAVTLGSIDAGIDTVSATAASGAMTFTVAANEAFVANLGSGNDVVTTSDSGFGTSSLFNIDAGAGTADKLIIAAATDVDTSNEAGRYDNFEVLSLSTSHDASLVSGIDTIEITAATTTSISNLSATQAANITFTAANATSTVLSLQDETGSSDSITINSTSGTSTTNFDLIGIDANFETVNFNATTGTNGTNSNIGFLQNTSDDIATVNIGGSADVELIVVDGTFDTKAVTIDASGLTGTGDLTITQTDAVLYKGSTVTGSSNGDTIAMTTTLGSTYNLGAGADGITGVVANFVADGTDDTTVTGGAGTDTLTLTDSTVTVTDNHFTNVTGLEALTLSGAMDVISITSGSAFDTQAFADGVTITIADVEAEANPTFAMGLYDQGATITVTSEGDGSEASKDDITVTTGDGADTISITAASYVGSGASGKAGGSINISTDGGNDTITVTTGTIVAQSTDEILTIDAGPGADTLTLTTNSVTTLEHTAANIVINAGDSLTTGRDDINGYDLATSTILAMELQFSGIAVASDFTNTNNYGVIKSHSLSGGLVSFDDVDSHATALIINSSNLSDVNSYLAGNMDNLDTVAFLYDSTGSGTNDSTMVYNKHASGDSLVELGGVTASSLVSGNTDVTTAGAIAIS
tara:strand:- start:20664 stop:23789 length:3126 start_codon:yes stop_codon:yes gene_type:complete